MSSSPVALPLWPALVPPALYLVAIAARHLRRRPTAVSGAADVAWLAAALAGLVLVGPMELLQPVGVRGVWRTVLPLLLVALAAALALLAGRPRLVVYNVSPEQLRPIVARVERCRPATSRCTSTRGAGFAA